jgi:hypothetical protein
MRKAWFRLVETRSTLSRCLLLFQPDSGVAESGKAVRDLYNELLKAREPMGRRPSEAQYETIARFMEQIGDLEAEFARRARFAVLFRNPLERRRRIWNRLRRRGPKAPVT